MPSSAKRWGSGRERLETTNQPKDLYQGSLVAKARASREKGRTNWVWTKAEPEPGPEMLGTGPPGPRAPMDRTDWRRMTHVKKGQAVAKTHIGCQAGQVKEAQTKDTAAPKGPGSGRAMLSHVGKTRA